MTRRSFGRDPGLQARMLLTRFLLGLVYAVLIAVALRAGAGTHMTPSRTHSCPD